VKFYNAYEFEKNINKKQDWLSIVGRSSMCVRTTLALTPWPWYSTLT